MPATDRRPNFRSYHWRGDQGESFAPACLHPLITEPINATKGAINCPSYRKDKEEITMKTSSKIFLAAVIGFACMSRSYAATDLKDGFMMKNGQLLITENNRTRPVVDDVQLYDGSVVRPDGTVIIPNDPRTTLHEGDTMSFGGTITRAATGTVEMTADGVIMKDGQIMIHSDGRTSLMNKDYVLLDDGTKVAKDGTIIAPNGHTNVLKDGDEILMNGKLQKY